MTTSKQWHTLIWSRPGMILAAIAVALACGGLDKQSSSHNQTSGSSDGDTTAKVDVFVPADESVQVSGANLQEWGLQDQTVGTFWGFTKSGSNFTLKQTPVVLTIVSQTATVTKFTTSEVTGALGTLGLLVVTRGSQTYSAPLTMNLTTPCVLTSKGVAPKLLGTLQRLTTGVAGAAVAAFTTPASINAAAAGENEYLAVEKNSSEILAQIAAKGAAAFAPYLQKISELAPIAAVDISTRVESGKTFSGYFPYTAAAAIGAAGAAAAAASAVKNSNPGSTESATPVPVVVPTTNSNEGNNSSPTPTPTLTPVPSVVQTVV